MFGMQTDCLIPEELALYEFIDYNYTYREVLTYNTITTRANNFVKLILAKKDGTGVHLEYYFSSFFTGSRESHMYFSIFI